MKHLNETQLGVLRLLSEGKSAYTYCQNRAEHGARTCTLMALRRRGLVAGHELTEAARELLAAAEARKAHNAVCSGVPAGGSSNNSAGGTSAGTQG